VAKKEKKLEMGGQAVIEGVMMRSPSGYSIAVRRRDKSIKIKSVPYLPLAKRIKLLGIPFLRGVVTLFEMLVVGFKGLDFSANEWEEPEEAKKDKPGKEEQTSPPPDQIPETETEEEPKEKKQVSPLAMTGVLLFSVGMVLVFTVVLPNFLTWLLGHLPLFKGGAAESGGTGLVESRSPLLYNLIAGVFRALILLAYIWLISLMKDIRRIFEYHGAEHKVVFAFEDKKPLTLESVRPYTTHHPRCGTTFLGVVILVSIVVFAFVAKLISIVYPPFLEMSLLPRKGIIIALHIAFMPLVAGVSYEVIKYGSRNLKNPLIRLLVLPGLLTQYITTREPDDEQLEVSIASLKAAMAIDANMEKPTITVIAPNESS